MKKDTIRLKNYYETAMSMGNSLDLKEMLEESLLAYLRNLDCSAGMVLTYTEQPDGTFKIDPVYAVPQNIAGDAAFRAALQRIPTRMEKARFSRFLDELPIKGEQGEDGFYLIMELLGFGLLLVKTGENLSHSVIESLTPLNEKLAGSAIACSQKEEMEQVNKLLKKEIKEHKQTEKALSESGISLRTLFESTPIGIVVTTLFGSMLTCNLLAAKILGCPPSELKHLGLKDVFFDPQERFRVLTALRKRGFIRDREVILKRKDGSTYYASLNVTPFTFEGKKALLTVFEDITVRKEMEEALRRSEKLYRAVVEDMPHMICRFLPGGTLTFVNSFYCEYLKRSRRELIGQDFFQLFLPEERGKIKNLFASLSIENPIATYKHRVLSPNGRKYWQEWVGHALYNDRGQFQEYQCLGRDITRQQQAQDEKEKLEKQLQHAQRMEGIGTLAGGIAHDFNNLLMGIQGRTSLLMLGISPSHPNHEHLAGIENYVKSAADLTRQLLGFARGGKYEVKPRDFYSAQIN
ncbi:MAG: PAS domain S-box protein [Candidatus Aminicenantes bacterium]|nr:PAS domain S-box protein [Candidatus Aminicenantes bacterium]